jgi:dienelactone hydrolase/pimeloyl-ACP methyl ester carboxylesterase
MKYFVQQRNRFQIRLLIAICWTVYLVWTPHLLVANQTAADPEKPLLEPLNRFPRMVQDWLVQQVRDKEVQHRAVYDNLQTEEQAREYVNSVRARIRDCFGPLPDKTPLHAKVTRSIDRDGYRIENIIYQSRPGFWVTGNLYLPTGNEKRLPAVLGVCGHSVNGKAVEAYQSFAQSLARQGFVVFIIDPVGQGERLQYWKPRDKPRYAIGTGEHIQMGNQLTLVGEFLGTWMVWDGIRGLDYLLSRPEVDPLRVGVTGNSGGGTQTTWLCGLEDRWTMAAPACFVTSLLRNLENELPADTEQCPPRVLSLGLDHADFLAALAPKPTIILAQEKDYFDARGAQAAHARLNRLYQRLGKPDQTQLHLGSEYHGYSQGNRQAMVRFFGAVSSVQTMEHEPKLTIESDDVLQCTPEGQVAAMGSRSIPSFTRQRSKELASSRPRLTPDKLKSAIQDTLRIPAKRSSLDFRILRNVGDRGYPTRHYVTYAVETEPGIHAIVTRLTDEPLMSRPPRSGATAILYVSHRSADAEIRADPMVAELLRQDPAAAFYAMDCRGIGESQPNVCGVDQFDRPYGSDYFHSAHGLMLDRPVLGQRTLDVMRVVEWLRESGHIQVHLAGRGWGAVAAMFAGGLCDEVERVTLKNCLSSFAVVAEEEEYKWPYSFMLPGVLHRFDLSECRALLKEKMLTETEPWGALDGGL